MAAALIALVVSADYALVLAGAGTLVSYRAFPVSSTLIERLALRCVLGIAVLPILIIAGFELTGLGFAIVPAMVVGAVGGLLLIHDELRLYRQRRSRPQSQPPSWERTAALVSLVVALICFLGAFRYSMFDGRDPYGHLLGVRYLLELGQLRQPFADWPVLHYIDGYPPLYDIFLALPTALTQLLAITAKASNALVVGLINLVLFYLARRLSRSSAVAVVATVLYAVLPGNLSRQIWGHSVAVLLLLTGLLLALRARAQQRWLVAAATCFAGALLAAPSQGVKAGILLGVTALVALRISRRWALRLVVIGVLALVLAMVWYLPLLLRVPLTTTDLIDAMDHPTLRHSGQRWHPETPEPWRGLSATLLGSGHSRTNLEDFVFFRSYDFMRRWYPARPRERIVPQGLGLAVTGLVIVFAAVCLRRLVRRRRASWRELVLAWLLVAVVGVLGRHLGIGFFVWRFWMLLCPLAAIAAAERLVALARSWTVSLSARVGLITVAMLAVAHGLISLLAAGNPPFLLLAAAVIAWLVLRHQRYQGVAGMLVAVVVCTQVWVALPVRLHVLTAAPDPTIVLNPIELTGYAQTITQTTHGERIFPLSDDDHCSILLAGDRTCRPWSPEQAKLRRQLLGSDPPAPEELVRRLQALGFRYATADPSFHHLLAGQIGKSAARRYLRRLIEDPQVTVVLTVGDESPAPFHLLQINASAGS